MSAPLPQRNDFQQSNEEFSLFAELPVLMTGHINTDDDSFGIVLNAACNDLLRAHQ